jgi:hypothetical protein
MNYESKNHTFIKTVAEQLLPYLLNHEENFQDFETEESKFGGERI